VQVCIKHLTWVLLPITEPYSGKIIWYQPAFDLPPENESSINVRLDNEKGGISLARRLFKPEQIINKLREAEILISQGSTIDQASRKIGITEQTYYC